MKWHTPMLKYILLGFLNYDSLTGYDLKRIIDTSTTHFWSAYHSQIYTTLRKMEADGLLTSQMDDDSDDKLNRRVYTITEAGQDALRTWLSEPLHDLPALKDDLMVRVFFSAQREKDDVLHELQLQRELRRQRLALYEQYAANGVVNLVPEHARSRMTHEAKFWHMTLLHGIQYEQMYIQWLDETIAWVEAL